MVKAKASIKAVRQTADNELYTNLCWILWAIRWRIRGDGVLYVVGSEIQSLINEKMNSDN